MSHVKLFLLEVVMHHVFGELMEPLIHYIEHCLYAFVRTILALIF